MIIVNSPLMQDKITQIVLNISDIHFEFVKKEGIQLFFKCDSSDLENAVAIIKKSIKNDPVGKTLLISVKEA